MTANTAIKNILFPADFSKLSGHAMISATAMCKRHSATLHVLHVTDSRFLIVPRDAHTTAVYLMTELEQSGMKSLKTLANKIISKHNIKVAKYLAFGRPADTIGKKAIESDCNIIVMGTHGASGLRGFFIGSNAYSVIKNTTVPVLTIPGKKKIKDFKKILFPIRASVRIIELGKALRLQDTAYKSVYFLCRTYAKKVLEIAKKEKVDLIAINASLDYKWRQFFIGPYTQPVVNHAKVPVMSFRTPNAGSDIEGAVKEALQNVKQMTLSV